MDKIVSLRKYLLTCALGFGLGGLIWGVVMYSELPDLEYPFHFMAILIMGLFGGISLTLFLKSVKKISKAVLVGFLGWGVGFVVAGIFSYPLTIVGGFFLSVVLPSSINVSFFELEPNIGIAIYWLLFFFTGTIISLFYSLFFKLKKWSLIWRGGVGFVFGSLIAPVIGNSFGFLLNCQLISYLLTFSLMSAIFGVFLAWGAYKYPKAE